MVMGPASVEGVGVDLSDRERRVLQALIDAHIATAEPVGSKVLASASDLGVSPATIRNILASLHDRGFITQPHTSAGRIPTDLGLRTYVDSLVSLRPPQPDEQTEIAVRIGGTGAVDDALREASRVLSRLARQTTVVVTLAPDSARLQHFELLRLRGDAVLVILVFADGKVQNRVIEWKHGEAPPPADLERLGRRISEKLQGKTLEEGRAVLAREIDAARHELRALEEKLLRLSAQSLNGGHNAGAVHVDGSAHLLSHANTPDDVARTKDLLALLDEDAQLRALLERAAQAPGIRVFIGEENAGSALSGGGLVTAAVSAGGALGVLGVIGPRNLDYGRVVPLVDVTAQAVRQALARVGSDA